MKRALPPAIVLASLTLAGCASSSEPTTGPVGTSPSGDVSTPSTQESPAAEQSAYVDGEYTARGWYGSLPSHHDVTLTIEDDTVAAVEITTPAEDETSLGYQERFASALPDAIIGRSIDELQIEKLAGSSGCSEGFMDALAKIKDDAGV